MGKEMELKYRGSPALFAALGDRYPGGREIAMHTCYLDTPEGSLARRKWMLRRRRENEKLLYCFKMPAPDGHRLEWESEIGIPELCAQGAPRELLQLGDFSPVAELRFTRRAVMLTLPDCKLELSMDEGAFYRGTARLPFRELELELKTGDFSAMEAFAQGLCREFSLETEKKSKQQRALEFAKGKADEGEMYV